MIEILARSIAHAGGIETPDNVRITGERSARPSLWRRFAKAFERWSARRSTYLALKALDGRTLRDIGIDRHLLHEVSADLARLSFANDNDRERGSECA